MYGNYLNLYSIFKLAILYIFFVQNYWTNSEYKKITKCKSLQNIWNCNTELLKSYQFRINSVSIPYPNFL